MKKIWIFAALILALGTMGCQKTETSENIKQEMSAESTHAVKIELSNEEILVDGEVISEDKDSAVYQAKDIIFYLEDQGITYGEGTEADEHSQAEADAHTVVHISEPGTYEISGKLDAGQIFVDLGDGTKDEEDAVATLVLNNADITCSVAPAIFFYRTYECLDVEEDEAVMDVDTSAAGANLILAEGSTNKIQGAYVAEIYESVEMSEDGTKVKASKRLHKYDGAIYSRRSMNIAGTGSLEVDAKNEGICSEMHLTINNGQISIKSGNDGINTNEDNISVFTMNDGVLDIQITGETGEGDGIDSNGWLVVNGGELYAAACATSMDSGVDADKGIYINGGTVAATGNMPAEIADGKLISVSFSTMDKMEAGQIYEVKNAKGDVVLEVSPKNSCTMMAVASENIIAEDTYTLWLGDKELAAGVSGSMNMFGTGRGEGRPEGMPEGMEPPEGFRGGERPQGMPEGMTPPQRNKR